MKEIKENFNYWDEDHYVEKEVIGSYKYCINAFKEECKIYPSREFSTHVQYKKKNKDNDYIFIIRRFKTQELFEIHAAYPPSCVRNGVVL